MSHELNSEFDVCIRGAGIVGRALALTLAREKLRVALVDGAQPRSQADVRAYALNNGSQRLLQGLRCWPAAAATPVHRMEVCGDGNGMLAFDASAVHATESEKAAQPLAWIVDVPALEDVLASAVNFQPLIEVVNAPVAASLTAICEGKFSDTREALGVDYQVVPYPQHAVATRLRSSISHQGVAKQWFCGTDILALLPLGGADGSEYAVVWSTEPEQAERLLALDESDFVAHLQAITLRAGQIDAGLDLEALPQLELIAPRARWPLRLAQAKQWTGRWPGNSNAGWALLGDAAHTVHPLAGSGLNLGLGDVQELAQQISQRQGWRAPGDRHILRNYERARKSALVPFVAATDGLQQLFSRDEALIHSLRNWGMNGFERAGFVKSWLIRQAMLS